MILSPSRRLASPARIAAVFLSLLAAGCGRYADFELPSPGGNAAEVVFRWDESPAPVLPRGAPGEWDSVDVLNPAIVKRRGLYLNLYSGFDGRTWHTGLATSADGVAWARKGRVLSPDPGSWEGGYIAANGAAAVSGGRFYYWYQAGGGPDGGAPRIGLALSADGERWQKQPAPVLETGPRGSWDERGVADPYVIRAGGAFYLFYLGQDRARRQRLGVARSGDGLNWVKLRSNPVLELGDAGSFDENGLGEPAVFLSHGWYWMLYTGRDRHENRRLGLARSRNGVTWQRVSREPVFTGGKAWDAKVVCDPEVEVLADGIRVWFGGGDVAAPAEKLNGQIGLARMVPAPRIGANLSE